MCKYEIICNYVYIIGYIIRKQKLDYYIQCTTVRQLDLPFDDGLFDWFNRIRNVLWLICRWLNDPVKFTGTNRCRSQRQCQCDRSSQWQWQCRVGENTVTNTQSMKCKIIHIILTILPNNRITVISDKLSAENIYRILLRLTTIQDIQQPSKHHLLRQPCWLFIGTPIEIV